MTNSKPSVIWALNIAGIFAVLTPFIAIIFAYLWRGKGSFAARLEIEAQIKLFWTCASIWAVALVLVGVSIAVDGGTAADRAPSMFILGLLIALGGQIWFMGRSALGLMQCLRRPSGHLAAA